MPGDDSQTNSSSYKRKANRPEKLQVESDSSQAFSIDESDTGATRVLHFRDKRPPHEVQFALERDLRTLFAPSMEDGKLCLTAKANVVGADYEFVLRFEAAYPEWNCYSLRAKAWWGELPTDHAEYFRKTSGSWFASWTDDLVAANPPLDNEGSGRALSPTMRGSDERRKATRFGRRDSTGDHSGHERGVRALAILTRKVAQEYIGRGNVSYVQTTATIPTSGNSRMKANSSRCCTSFVIGRRRVTLSRTNFPRSIHGG